MSADNVTWMKFYPQDWLADPGLRMCSPAARGVWMDFIAIMHDARPYGHLVLGGRAPDAAALGRLVGLSAQAVRKIVSELERNNVCGRTDEGVIFSRRMVRDEAAREQGRAYASKGRGEGGGTPPTPPTTPPGGEGEGVGGGRGEAPHPPRGEPPLSRARERPETRGQKKNTLPSVGCSASASPRRTPHRLPDDWTPPPGADPHAVAAFRDHWQASAGKGALKLDWDAAFRTWLRIAAERQAHHRTAQPRDDAHSRRVVNFRAMANESGVTLADLGLLP